MSNIVRALNYPMYAIDFTRKGSIAPWKLQNGAVRRGVGLYFPPEAATTPRAELVMPLVPPDLWLRFYPMTYLAVVIRYGTFTTNDSVLLALRTSAYGPSTQTGGMLMRGSDGYVYFNDPGVAGSYGSVGVPADGREHVVTEVMTANTTFGYMDTTQIYSSAPSRSAIPYPKPATDRWVVGQANQSGQLGHAISAVALIKGALTSAEREALVRDWRSLLFPNRMASTALVPVRTLRPQWDVANTNWSAV